MKKRYTVSLNEEPTELVQKWLAQNKMTFSGWMTVIVDELAKSIQGGPEPKNIKDMTLEEFINVAGYWYKKATEDEE